MKRYIFVASLFFGASSLFALEPNVPSSTYLDRAKQSFQEGKFPEALVALNAFEESNEATGRSIDLRGRIFLEQGQLDEAAKFFTAAHDKDTTSPGQIHLADVLLRQKKFAEAREAYRKAIKETTLLPLYERLRFGMLLSYLGAKDDVGGQQALDQIKFPSESGAYYFAQAAWSYAHGQTRDAEKWTKRADEIYTSQMTNWFARWLYEFGWTKTKPPLSPD